MDWKDKGNAAFQKNNLPEAISCYTKAIESDPTNHLFYSNRSTAYFNSKEYVKSLEDAVKTLELKPDWVKAHFRKAECLFKIDRLKESTLAIELAYIIEPDNGSVKNLLEEVNKKYVDRFFKSITQKMEVYVKYISIKRGKGVFARRNFQKGEVLFEETPVTSHRSVKDLAGTDYCSYTMTTKLDTSTIPQPFKTAMIEFYSNNPKNYVSCPYCKVLMALIGGI